MGGYTSADKRLQSAPRAPSAAKSASFTTVAISVCPPRAQRSEGALNRSGTFAAERKRVNKNGLNRQ